MRNFDDWLSAFLDYTSHGEAPKRMYFWAGASAIAGALRRKVWIDEISFKWYPNMYVVFVAPPGVVSKSTTASLAMDLLREVPGINFGPDVVTWPALVSAFVDALEGVETPDGIVPMSAITMESSEFGNLLNPNDQGMLNLLIELWDGRAKAFEKRTKYSGSEKIQNPWINMIACTTPSWIAINFPENIIGGGFTSRCIFVYADTKERFVAYPSKVAQVDVSETRNRLIEDLIEISKLQGEYKLSDEAVEWGEQWYESLMHKSRDKMHDDRIGYYISRKQTHVHKLAMIITASSSDELTIPLENLQTAEQMVTELEPDMHFVFSKVGKSDISAHADKIVMYVHGRGRVPYTEVYRYVHTYFPFVKNFADIVLSLHEAGYVKVEKDQKGVPFIVAAKALPRASN